MDKTTNLRVDGMDLSSTIIKFLDEKVTTMVIKKEKIKMSEDQRNFFFSHCIYNKLNPYKGEVHAVPFWSGDGYTIVPVTSYKVFLNRAIKSKVFGGMSFESLYKDVTYKQFKKDENGQESDTGAFVTKSEWVGLKMILIRTDRKNPYVEDGLFADKAQYITDRNTKEVRVSDMRDKNKSFMLKKQMIREIIPMVFSDYMDVCDQVDESSEMPSDISITIDDIDSLGVAVDNI